MNPTFSVGEPREMNSKASTTRRQLTIGICGLLAAVLVAAGTVAAQSPEWPQWGGPHRDFTSDAKGLARSWPEAGPRRLWSRPLGEGYSSIVVDGRTLYTMYRNQGQDVVVALEAATGKTIWEYAYDAPFIVAGREADIVKEYHLDKGPGPMSTPLIVGDSLFAVGATGKFHALDKKTGRVMWAHDFITELQGFVRQRGYTCSPFAYKNTVIMPVGAAGGSIMAFNQRDGSIVWKKHDFRHAYASPVLIRVDGQEQLVFFMLEGLVGVEPDTGDLLWTYPTNNTQGVNVSTPVWGEGNKLFVSSSYGFGSHVLELTRAGNKTSVREVWGNLKMRLHFANAIRIGNVVYGSSGDFGPAFFTAVDVRTGDIMWQDRRLGRASFIYADGRFIMVDEDGKLVLATPSPEGLTIHSTVELLQPNAWTVPTLVGKTLYVRDRKTIMALDLS